MPLYEVIVQDLDRLIIELLDLCSYNPFVFAPIKDFGLDVLMDDNPVGDRWKRKSN